MIVARVIDARSKLAMNPESAVSTLGQILGLEAVDENDTKRWTYGASGASNSAWRDAI